MLHQRSIRSHAVINCRGAASFNEYEALQAKSAQLRLPLDEEPASARRGRLAVMMGFSLHADTATAANDRDGLLRLARYGARGPVAESRLSRREDGRYAYETKKGVTLVLTAAQLVKRLIALVAPKGLHLTNFHGVLAPAAAARSTVLLPSKRGLHDRATSLLRSAGGEECQTGMIPV